MKRWARNLVLGGAALLSGVPSLAAEVTGNPFQVIVERNAFRLKPAPAPQVVSTNPPPPPPSNVRLTGVYEWSGVKKAVLEITDPVSKKVDHPMPLVEGDEQGLVKIISIDVKAGKVEIQNGTETATLTFDTKPAGPVAGGTPGGMPGLVPGMPPGMVPGQFQPGVRAPNPFQLGGQPNPAAMNPSGAGMLHPGAAAGSSGGNVMVGGAGNTGLPAPPAAPQMDYSTGIGMPIRPQRPTVGSSGNVVVGGFGSQPTPTVPLPTPVPIPTSPQ